MKILPAQNKIYFLIIITFLVSCVQFEPEAPEAGPPSVNPVPKTEKSLNRTVSKIIQSVQSIDARSGYRVSFEQTQKNISKVELKFDDAVNPVLILSVDEIDSHNNAYIFAPTNKSNLLQVKTILKNNTSRNKTIKLIRNQVNLIRI